MGDRNTFKGCVLAVLAGVCFATGVSLLTDERGVGGILLSTAIFLSGLAFTVMSTKNEESADEQNID